MGILSRDDLSRGWRHCWVCMRYVLRRMNEERVADVAGSLTFTIVLSLVPLITIIFAVLTPFPVFAHMRDALHDLLLKNLIPAALVDTVFRYLNLFASKARGLTIFGLLFLMITALSTMLIIDRALNRIWRVSKPRPFKQRLLIYWSVLTLGPLLFAASVSVTSYLFALTGLGKRPPMLLRLALGGLPIVMSALAYASLYRFVPNRVVQWRHALIGGLGAALAFEIAKRAFALYIASGASYTTVYGALAALPIFLLWIYLSCLVTLWGASLAASWPELNTALVHDDAPGVIYADVLQILRILYQARYAYQAQGKLGLSLEQIRVQAHLGWSKVENLLERLEADGLIIRVAQITPSTPARAYRQRQRQRQNYWRHEQQYYWMFAAHPQQVRLELLWRNFVYDGARVAQVTMKPHDPLAALLIAAPFAHLDTTLADALVA